MASYFWMSCSTFVTFRFVLRLKHGESSPGYGVQGCCAKYDIRLKLILNSNLVKTRSSMTSVAVVQSFWNFAQNSIVSLPCPVQHFETLKVMDKWVFARLEFKVRFEWISHIAQGPSCVYHPRIRCTSQALWVTLYQIPWWRLSTKYQYTLPFNFG